MGSALYSVAITQPLTGASAQNPQHQSTPAQLLSLQTCSLESTGDGWPESRQSMCSKFHWLDFHLREIIKALAKAYESIFVSLILFIMYFINIFRRDCALI